MLLIQIYDFLKPEKALILLVHILSILYVLLKNNIEKFYCHSEAGWINKRCICEVCEIEICGKNNKNKIENFLNFYFDLK